MAYPTSNPHRSLRGCMLAALLAACTLLALPGAALAAPPANDAFLTAELLTGPTATSTGTNAEATKETGEPSHAYHTGGHSLWYRWIAPSEGIVTIDTAGSRFDTTLAAYTGLTVDGLTAIASNDDYGGLTSRVRFAVTGGQTYMIAVDGYSSSSVGSVTLHLAYGPAPPNDAFASAQPLSGEQSSGTGDSSSATREAGEPYHGGYGERSLWYSWTAPYTGAATVDTAGSNFNTLLAVYTGDSVASLISAAWNDNASSVTTTSRTTFRAIEGVTYRIAVAGSGDVGGSVALSVSLRALPENDLFASATVLPGDADVVVAGRNDGASVEPGEPSPFSFDPARRSVWFSWTAPHSGSATINASGNFGTVVAAYSGTQVGGLTRVANQAQPGSPGPGQIRVRVSAGVTYSIAVDSLSYSMAGGGDFTLSLHLIDSPPNDDFADAQLLVGVAADVDGTNVGATQEPCEPIHDLNYYDPSVWYTWTAPASGGVTIDMAGSELDAVVGVYTGDSLCLLARVNTTRTSGALKAKRRFRAAAGVTYRIAVDGMQARQGTFHLALRFRPAPLNDMFAAAEPLLADVPVTTSGDNIGATGENGEPNAGGTAGASVWYRWTPTSTGLAVVSTPRFDFTNTVTVYTGDSVDALTRVVGPGTTPAYGMRFRAVAGTTYRIAVDGGSAAQRGEFTLKLETRPSPPNDDFANAVVLAGEPAAAAGTNQNATKETGEPGYRGGISVWYQWTAPRDGRTVLTLANAGFYPTLDVYTGDSLPTLTPIPPTDYSSGSRLAFRATSGVTYRIRVDSSYYYADGGTFDLQLEQAEAPPNDLFANATVMTGSVDDATGTTRGAGHEYYESSYAYRGQASIWYRWRAPATGPVTIDTSGSDFDTTLAAYTGGYVDWLYSVASNDNADGTPQSRITFAATAGTVYRIAVDGPGGATGQVALHLRFASPPVNDGFADAVALDGDSPTATGTNVGATKEPGEPQHAGGAGGASVWYSWTAPADGSLQLSTAGSQFPTLLGVYTGDSVGALSEVGSGAAGAQVDVQEGTTYRIAIDGSNSDRAGPQEGSLRLALNLTRPAAPGLALALAPQDASPPSADAPAGEPPRVAAPPQGPFDDRTGSAEPSDEPAAPTPLPPSPPVSPPPDHPAEAPVVPAGDPPADPPTATPADPPTTPPAAAPAAPPAPAPAAAPAAPSADPMAAPPAAPRNDPPAVEPPTVPAPAPESTNQAPAPPADVPPVSPPADHPASPPAAAPPISPPADHPASPPAANPPVSPPADHPATQPATAPPISPPADHPATPPTAEPPADHPAPPAAEPHVSSPADHPAAPPAANPPATPPAKDPPVNPPANPPADQPSTPAADPPANPSPNPPAGPPAVVDPPPAIVPAPIVEWHAAAPPPEQAPTTAPATKPAPPAFRYTTSGQRLGEVLRGGLKGTVACSAECRVAARTSLGSIISRASAYSATGAATHLTVKLPAAAMRKLRNARSAKLTVKIVAQIDGQTVSLTRRLTLRR
jgi:hypothetical protein